MESRSDPRDDATLARAAGAGDRGALEALLDRHIDRIHAVCRRICGPDDAFDATQDALISITRSIGRFDGQSAVTTWMHRVATNAALDELRRRKRRPDPVAADADSVIALISASRAGDPERAGDRIDLDAALAKLPDEFRIAVVLRDVADLDYAEIATVLAVPIGTVRSRISRGRAALARELGNQDRPTDVQGSDHA
ncbi:MAG: sigma-70 family RNA polymerase sigma factor [Acidimicrobiia bacterium]